MIGSLRGKRTARGTTVETWRPDASARGCSPAAAPESADAGTNWDELDAYHRRSYCCFSRGGNDEGVMTPSAAHVGAGEGFDENRREWRRWRWRRPCPLSLIWTQNDGARRTNLIWPRRTPVRRRERGTYVVPGRRRARSCQTRPGRSSNSQPRTRRDPLRRPASQGALADARRLHPEANKDRPPDGRGTRGNKRNLFSLALQA